jgi:Chlamydia polymorphic membrane protein (Chlamydia_PMP) repeat
MADFGRLLTVLGAGLTLAACSAAAHPASTTPPASAAHPAAAQPSAPMPGGAAAGASSAGPAQAAAATAQVPLPTADPAAATASRPAASAASEASRALPLYGNPGGTAPVPPAARAVGTAHPNHVIGNGSPAGCTSAAVVAAVAKGGIITFNCGPSAVTIMMTATAKVVNTHRRTVIDGGGKVTLNGGGQHRILYMNACDPKQKITTNDCWEQQWPLLVVQNLTFRNAYSGVRQTKTSYYGGGAIYAQGGQLKVVNSGFIYDKCYRYGPDLGGGAIRAVGMHMSTPIYINHDTFRGNTCSNGAALSGLYANFDVINSFFKGNKAIGWGQNPTQTGTPGGGSGGAIYTDGNSYNLVIAGSVMRDNTAREGGGAIFFVVDGGPGTLTIENASALSHNTSGQFQNAPGIFDSVDGKDTPPVVTGGSTVT